MCLTKDYNFTKSKLRSQKFKIDFRFLLNWKLSKINQIVPNWEQVTAQLLA